MLVVVVVVELHADVVELTGGPQELALDRIRIDELQTDELIKHREPEVGDVLHVRGPSVVPVREVLYAAAAHIVDEWLAGLPREQHLIGGHAARPGKLLREQDALAESVFRGFHSGCARGLDGGGDHHGAREDDVGARWLDPAEPRTILGGSAPHLLDELIEGCRDR